MNVRYKIWSIIMKINIGTAGVPISTKEHNTIEGIRRVKELGLQAMEVEFVRGVAMGNGLAKKAGKVAKEDGIILSVHAPYYINLCNPEKAEASMKRILDSCERAHHLGAEVVVFHPGFYGDLSKEECSKRVFNACKEMNNILRENKWNVKLGMETTGKVSQFGTLDEIIDIHEKIRNCIPVVDWSHMFARDNGKIDFAEIVKKLESLNLPKYHTHFSGIEFTEKGERRHIVLEYKQPDFEELVKVLMRSRIKEMTIICESPILEKDALYMIDTLKRNGYN